MTTAKTISTVRSAMHDVGRAVSAQELYRLFHSQGRAVGLATVYRALDSLVGAGEAEKIRRDAEDTYVLCPTDHHHHAVCRQCGRVDTLAVCPIEPAEPHRSEGGFHIDGHEAVYYGQCPECYSNRLGGA